MVLYLSTIGLAHTKTNMSDDMAMSELLYANVTVLIYTVIFLFHCNTQNIV